jgi:hypothetical protein
MEAARVAGGAPWKACRHCLKRLVGGFPRSTRPTSKTVFENFQDVAKNRPVGRVGVGVEALKHACELGADLQSLTHRAMLLQVFVSHASEQLQSFMKDGQLDSVVFRESARFPMERMEVRVVREGLPFDAGELLRRIGAADGWDVHGEPSG